ncbi:MAG: hypothetical protein AAF467_20915 [Actinomycetota bacterium]
MTRFMMLVAGIGLMLAVSVGTAPEEAEAETFFGWSYDVEVSGSRFDGLALNNVTYEGTKIFERISLPTMNVFYQNNACGPYVDRLGGSSYTGPFGEEFTQNGVRWRSIGITDQIGNYVITMIYYLGENGEFDAHMFSRGLQCNIWHEHLPFWRMDIDLAGQDNDQVLRATGGGSQVESREFSLAATAAQNHGWEVRDSVTGDRLTIAFDDGTFSLPGTVIPETQYAQNMVYGRQYRSNETTWQGGATRNTLFGANNETITDLVLWYSGYMPHAPEEGPDLWHSTGIRMQVELAGDGDGDGGGGGGGQATIGDRVTNASGAGVSGVTIDLFAEANGGRGAWLGDARTNANGTYSFNTAAGCYVLVFIAPSGQTWQGGSQYLQRSVCVNAGETDNSVDVVLGGGGGSGGGGGGDASIGDRVTDSGGSGVAGVVVDLFAANGDGSRGRWVGDAATDGGGRYGFDVDAGCYVLVFIAPQGRTFTTGGQYNQQFACVAAGATDNSVDAVLSGGGGGGGTVTIGDRVTRSGGGGVPGVTIDLFNADGSGTRGTWLGDTTTNASGNYQFQPPAGCYVVVFIAPSGQTFVGGSRWNQQFVCVNSAGGTNNSVDAVLT